MKPPTLIVLSSPEGTVTCLRWGTFLNQALMPGYQSLPVWWTGVTADLSRQSDALAKAGEIDEAVALLQRALAQSMAERPGMPGFVVGRLAVLYRRAGRHDEEVDLLERYQDSQSDEAAKGRFAARLTKARALAAKHQPVVSGALASVRAVTDRLPKRPRAPR